MAGRLTHNGAALPSPPPTAIAHRLGEVNAQLHDLKLRQNMVSLELFMRASNKDLRRPGSTVLEATVRSGEGPMIARSHSLALP